MKIILLFSQEKIGAHEISCLKNFNLFDPLKDLCSVYGSLDLIEKSTAIITLAPELDSTGIVTRNLTERGIIVSLGHSAASLSQGEQCISNGARMITHMFNAMLPFHHRDPHLFGLLSNRHITSKNGNHIYYGIIADGVHAHKAAINICYKAHPQGLVLVTDAISATGLDESLTHKLGQIFVDVKYLNDDKTQKCAYVHDTNTLCGSVITLDQCVRNLNDATGCGIVKALQSASEHPAKLLNIYPTKGSLDFDSHADFILLSKDKYEVEATFINGDLVWCKNEWNPLFKYKRDEEI
jgi:N-acetylglucosamine-6-phosphate deacetylase